MPRGMSRVSAVGEKFGRCSATARLGSLKCVTQQRYLQPRASIMLAKTKTGKVGTVPMIAGSCRTSFRSTHSEPWCACSAMGVLRAKLLKGVGTPQRRTEDSLR